MRRAERPAEHVQRAPGRVQVVLQVRGDDVQPRQLVELAEIGQEGVLDDVGGDVPLQQGALQLGEQVGLLVAELRFQPVLRVEEDLPVRLPDPVAPHPLPLCRVHRLRRHLRFQVEQDAVDEQLYGRRRQPDPRGLHHRFHPGVDEEVLVQLLHGGQPQLVADVGYQSVPLPGTQPVEDRLGEPLPAGRLERRPDRVLHLGGDPIAPLLVGGPDERAPPHQRVGGHSQRADHAQRVDEPPDRPVVGERRRGGEDGRRRGDRCDTLPGQVGDDRVHLRRQPVRLRAGVRLQDRQELATAAELPPQLRVLGEPVQPPQPSDPGRPIGRLVAGTAGGQVPQPQAGELLRMRRQVPDLGRAQLQDLDQPEHLPHQDQGGACPGHDVLRVQPEPGHAAAGQSAAAHVQPDAARLVGAPADRVEPAGLQLDGCGELGVGGGRGAAQHDWLGQVVEPQLAGDARGVGDRREAVHAADRHLEKALETGRRGAGGEGGVQVFEGGEQRLGRTEKRAVGEQVPHQGRIGTAAGARSDRLHRQLTDQPALQERQEGRGQDGPLAPDRLVDSPAGGEFRLRRQAGRDRRQRGDQQAELGIAEEPEARRGVDLLLAQVGLEELLH